MTTFLIKIKIYSIKNSASKKPSFCFSYLIYFVIVVFSIFAGLSGFKPFRQLILQASICANTANAKAEIFSGKGPIIPVEIISIRNSDAYFNSSFTQAGINQTLHQLSMSVLVDVSVLVLGEAASFTVTSEVVVAETIIVGDVPDTFFQTGGTYGNS